MNEKWFSLEIEEIEKKLNTNAASGLSRKAARSRLRKEGKNNFFHLRQRSVGECARRVFSDPMLILIIAVNIIAAIFGRVSTAIISGAFIAANVISAILVYTKSCRITESMAEYSQPKIHVIRDGKLFYADSRALVRGDIVLLGEGDVLPCDVRIINTNGLSVETYAGERADEAPKVSVKHANTVPLIDPSDMLDCGNMVFAGSHVVSGSARAVVVEVGDHTYIGALDGGIPLNNTADGLVALRKLKKASQIYGFIILAAILPLTVLGIFTFGFSNMLDTFMLVMSLSVSSLGELIYVIGGISVSSGLMELAAENGGRGGAIVQSVGKLDKIAGTDYIFLLGDAALTDGSFKVDRVITGVGDYFGKEILTPKASGVAELLMMLEYTRSMTPGTLDSGRRPIEEALGFYGKKIGVDVDSFPIRIKYAAHFPQNTATQFECASILAAGERITVFSSDSSELLDRCSYIRTDGGTVALDAETRSEISKKVSEAARSGSHIRICATVRGAEQGGRPSLNGAVFEGAFVLSKILGKDFARYKAVLEKAGIKAVLFANSEKPFDIRESMRMFGIASRNDVLTYSAFCERPMKLTLCLEGYRIFAGFPSDKIVDMVEALQKEGKTVESVGITAEDLDVLSSSDVSVTFSSSVYKTEGMDFTALESPTDSGKPYSKEGAQTLRCTSDSTVHRASIRGGGLEGLFNMARVAGGIHRNIENITTYLICSQAARLVISVIFSLVFGRLLLTPVQLLIGGMAFDFLVAIMMSFDTHRLHKSRNVDIGVKSIKPWLICTAVAAFVTGLAALTVSFISKADVSRAVFVSVALMQILMFTLIRRDSGCRKVFGRFCIMLICIFLVTVLIFSAITPIAIAAGSRQASALSLILIPISPAAFAVCYFAHSVKKGKHRA